MARVREVGESRCVSSPEEAAAYWHEVVEARSWFQPSREHVVTLLLNSRMHLSGHHLVSIGTLNECMAHPRDILGPVLCGAAFKFILMHNHPSGHAKPSPSDTALTRRVKEAADLLCVELADHVIVGSHGRYFSYREEGYL